MFPRWLSWMFVLVLFYMVYAASSTHRAVEENRPGSVPVITKETFPELAKVTDVEAWKRKLDPHYAAVMDCEAPAATEGVLAMKLVQETTGSGTPAKCGETITLDLTVWGSTGDTQYHGSVDLALGSRQLAAGLDYGLLGIQPGGVRTITLPPAAQDRIKKSPLPEALLTTLPTGKPARVVVITAKRVK